MRFSLLGPLVVADSTGSPVALGGPRLRVLLAALLLRAGIPVAAGELAEVVWDGSPPPGAVSTLRSYVRRLRRALGADAARIVASGPGYLIRVSRGELDVLEFEQFCRDARVALRAGEWGDASTAVARALRLWRAAPLLDVPSEALRREFVPRLERLRMQVLEDRFDAGLRLGHEQELVPQLLDMTARYPLQERFHAQLMLALASTGRRAQALHAYQEARRVLIDELGIEPGTELRDIHRQILAGDVGEIPARAEDSQARGIPATSTAAAPAGVSDPSAEEAPAAEPAGLISPPPAQLPADIADFTGRGRQAGQVRRALIGGDGVSGPGTVRIVVVAGSAGLGKTTLAVHAAHQVRDRFPDGQLFVRLAGASGQSAVAGEVLARLLRDLGVDGDKIPAGEEERAALYRTRLDGRRMLILLDDAKDAAQVRPLLPGSASCAVVVTTRNRTPNLLSTAFVGLGTLPGPEALELFSRVVGDARPAAEPEATTDVLRACAGLPLAIRICAARLATRPQWRIATMAARLHNERRRLDELQVGDLEVRASFQVSYDSLDSGGQCADPARVFRLLGLWQGQRICLPAITAMVGEREEDVAGALEMLVDANLLESPEPDWYQLHDLLRLFAAERAQAEEGQEACLRTMTWLLQWYLAMAVAAADVLSPSRYRPPGEGPSAPGPSPGSAAQDALAWYDREYANLIAAIRQAAAAGLHDATWRLATALFPLFGRRYNWADCITAHRIAVNSARVTGSRPGEAWALHYLGCGLAMLGDTEAFGCLQEALAVRQATGDLGGETQTAIVLTVAHYKIHGPAEAYDHSLRCLELLRRAGNPALLGAGLNNHGEICRVLGKAGEAAECLQEALSIWTAIGGGNGHGQALENLGRIHLESGRLPEAITSLSEAYRIFLAQGHLEGQAVALQHLGEAQRRAGWADQARESLEAALVLFMDLDATAEVGNIQAALAALAQPGPRFSPSLMACRESSG